ncbi:MAG: MFS transporter [Dermatophilaceae bacterium]
MTPGPANPSLGGPMAPAYRLVTVALVLLTTMVAFENMAVMTAMPQAASDLDAAGSYGLAFSAMMTAMLLGIVLAGSWADRSGPLAPLYAGQLLFALGSAACALAPSFASLLGARVVTGLGGGLVTVAEFVAIGRAYPASLHPRVFTWVSAAWVLPSVVGAPVAGWLATTWSWRAVFWVVLGPALVAMVLVVARRSAFAARQQAPAPELDRDQHRRLARLGALVAVSCGALQLAIHEQSPAASPMTLLGAAGLVGLALTAPRLLPDGALAGRRGLPSVVLSRGLLNAAFSGSVAFVPLLLVRECGLSLAAAGLVVAVASLGWSVGAWVQGRVRVTRPAARSRLVTLGAGLLGTGCAGLVVVAVGGLPAWTVAIAMVPLGLGMGIGSTTLSVLVLDLSPVEEHGRAAAGLQLADVLGSVVGIAVATTAYALLAGPNGRLGYVVMWSLLAAVAWLGVVTGVRCSPSEDVAAAGAHP